MGAAMQCYEHAYAHLQAGNLPQGINCQIFLAVLLLLPQSHSFLLYRKGCTPKELHR